MARNDVRIAFSIARLPRLNAARLRTPALAMTAA
jgi:hypothetical protein